MLIRQDHKVKEHSEVTTTWILYGLRYRVTQVEVSADVGFSALLRSEEHEGLSYEEAEAKFKELTTSD